MIKINGKKVDINYFPDGTLLLKEALTDASEAGNDSAGGQSTEKKGAVTIRWNYENNEELLAVYFLAKHIRAAGYHDLILDMP